MYLPEAWQEELTQSRRGAESRRGRRERKTTEGDDPCTLGLFFFLFPSLLSSFLCASAALREFFPGASFQLAPTVSGGGCRSRCSSGCPCGWSCRSGGRGP